MPYTGYGAVGNGFRIGGSFRSGTISSTSYDHNSHYAVEIAASFGGLLLEKATVIKDYNIYGGLLFGGASIEVQPHKTSKSSLSDISSLEASDLIDNSFNKLTSQSVLLELHTGGTYTMVKWCHVGVDLSLPLFFSPSGFKSPVGNSLTNPFFTANPGLRFRIIFGNIG